MPAEAFFDSNVVLYAIADRGAKGDNARELVSARGSVSVQVLNETANVLIRKLGWSWPAVELALLGLRLSLAVSDVTLQTHGLGLRLARQHRFQLFDAMIVASALHAGCVTLWSEDMHDGMLVDGRMTIRNPFAGG